jgi:RNA dependent RNA polymerase
MLPTARSRPPPRTTGLAEPAATAAVATATITRTRISRAGRSPGAVEQDEQRQQFEEDGQKVSAVLLVASSTVAAMVTPERTRNHNGDVNDDDGVDDAWSLDGYFSANAFDDDDIDDNEESSAVKKKNTPEIAESNVDEDAVEEEEEEDDDDDNDSCSSYESVNGTTRLIKSRRGGYKVVPAQVGAAPLDDDTAEDDESGREAEYLVDCLCDVRRCRRRRTRNTFEFLVKWYKYDGADTWEPMEHLNAEGPLLLEMEKLLLAKGFIVSSDDSDDDEVVDSLDVDAAAAAAAADDNDNGNTNSVKRLLARTAAAKRQPAKKKQRRQSPRSTTTSNPGTTKNKTARRITTTKPKKKEKKRSGQGISTEMISPMQVIDGKTTTTTTLHHHNPATKIILGSINTCLASRIFGRRLRKYADLKLSQELQATMYADGMKLALVGTKMSNNNNNKGGGGGKMQQKTQSAYYVVEEGGGFAKISLRDELDKLADFASIPSSNKCAARLELLFTEAAQLSSGTYRVIENLSPDMFEVIAEDHHIGSGFIPRHMLQDFLGTGKPGLMSTSIQVRIIVPKLGLFKGVLQAKNGIDKIQLPTSMRKVGPTKHNDRFNQACLLIKLVFPSTLNQKMDKLLSRQQNLSSSETRELCYHKQRMSDMISRVLQEAGVDGARIKQYSSKVSTNTKDIAHASLIGLCDPTHGCAIPAGHVFVTGLVAALPHVTEVIVTRFPCTSRYDQRTLPIVREKPANMRDEDWDELMARSFGEIIFGNPHVGHVPIPETIANGDLDGDLYFVTWYQPFLEQAFKGASGNDRLAENVDQVDVDDDDDEELPYNPAWLSEAQSFLCNTEYQKDYGRIIGALHSQWAMLVDAKQQRQRSVVRQPVIEAFGRAFKQSLEIKKHGGKIYLPGHLWHRIKPISLHSFLKTDPDDIVGALHTQWTDAVARDPKCHAAKALGQALKQSLEEVEPPHDDKLIYLPKELWRRIEPMTLHRFLTSSSTATTAN